MHRQIKLINNHHNSIYYFQIDFEYNLNLKKSENNPMIIDLSDFLDFFKDLEEINTILESKNRPRITGSINYNSCQIIDSFKSLKGVYDWELSNDDYFITEQQYILKSYNPDILFSEIEFQKISKFLLKSLNKGYINNNNAELTNEPNEEISYTLTVDLSNLSFEYSEG